MPRAAVASALVLLAACGNGPPPYGFGTAPEQSFRFEAEDVTVVDGVEVRVSRFAEFRLRAQPLEAGGTELTAYLSRYYERVEPPEGGTEVGISDRGVIVRRAGEEELRLGPDDRTPTAPSIRSLLERPIASAVLDARGKAVSPLWHAHDPLLAKIDPLEWYLVGVPVLRTDAPATWSGSREVPRIGDYRLGVELPIRYERVAAVSGGPPVIRARGFARRAEIKLAEGFAGRLELDYRGEAELDSEARLKVSTSELELRFKSTDGGEIASTHRVRVSCAECTPAFNSQVPAPDH